MSVRFGVVFSSSAVEVGPQSTATTSVGGGTLFGGLASLGLGGPPRISAADNPFGSVTQSEW